MSTPETPRVLAEIAAERAAQDARWGRQDHPDRMPADYPVGDTPNAVLAAVHWKNTNAARVAWMNEHGVPRDRNAAWDGVLLEEVYEALAETDPAKLRAELVQVAAVAAAWVEAIDRRTAPVSPSEDTPARVWQAGDTIPAHLRSVYGKRTQHFRQADDQNRGADGWWSPGTGVISEHRLLAEHGPVSVVPAGGEPA